VVALLHQLVHGAAAATAGVVRCPLVSNSSSIHM
jgi:hypothetical protein